MQKHLDFTVTIWSSEIAPRLTFFNLKSSQKQMTIYDKATKEDDQKVYNNIVCCKHDALWPYSRSLGTFAIHAAICRKICEQESNSVEWRANLKGVSEMFTYICPLCSDAD